MTSKLRAYVVLLLAFVLGGLAGGGGVFASLRREQTHESREVREARRLAAFEQRLGLTPEQRTAVAAILERQREERRRSWSRFDAEIRALLDPEQQKKFDVLAQERRSRTGPPSASSVP